MSKSKRKPRPEVADYFWRDSDGCWWCKDKTGCGSCAVLKEQAAYERKKRKPKKNVHYSEWADE